jgi:hypothetical protein
MKASGQLMSKANCGPYRQLSEQKIHTHTRAVAKKSHWPMGKKSGIMAMGFVDHLRNFYLHTCTRFTLKSNKDKGLPTFLSLLLQLLYRA